MKRLALFLCILNTLAACSSAREGASPTCAANLAAGDLTITEIMADPSGADTGKEWFEVKNNRSSSFDLAGVVLAAAKSDGTSEVTHAVTHQMIAANGFVVFGGAAPMPKPAFVDYDYGNDLGALRNDSGRLTLRCGSVTVAQAGYNGPVEGASLQLDTSGVWCDSTMEYEPGDKGSPGKANAKCKAPVSGTTCDDHGTSRNIDPPGPGDLVISEIMPNPNKVSDENGEWFEVTVTRDLDSNGLQLGNTPGTAATTISDGECRHHAAGSQVVFARSADPAVNGGLPAVEGTFSFGLSNSGGTIWVGAGGVILDQVSWTRSFDGASLSLDPGSLDPLANDDELHFCAGQSTYGDGDKGTPGAANDSCGGTVPTGQCMENGVQRDVRAPAAGDLVITEYLANPAGADGGKEWFEVLVKKDVDLNGLQLGTTFPTVAQTVNSPECLPVVAGTYLVFSDNDGSTDDGGLPREDFHFSFDLTNANRGIFLGFGGTLVDAVTYGDVTEGASRNLDAGKLDATTNDDDNSWCDGGDPYGDGTNRGTPGAPNATCPPPNGCRDGDTVRDIVHPGAGDVVITELMPDPSEVGDEEGEWFELLLKKDVDLNGVQLGTKPGTPALTIANGTCLRRAAGSRLVFAHSGDPTVNGGLPAVDQTFAFGLSNSGGTLFVAVGGNVLDQMTWTGSTSGVSRSLDPGAEDPVANDADTSWCGATSRYGAGDRGTPGAPNDACPVVLPPGKCMDGGQLRDAVAPKAGDLVISELLADASGADTGKEWFEVYVAHDVDLNGLEMGTNSPTVLTAVSQPACLHAAAGSYVVFSHNDGMTPNGGLPRVDATFDFSLVNGGGGLFVGFGGAVIDAVTYGAVREGVARSLDPSNLDATADDDQQAWCDATMSYGDGDKGTPGMANPACPPVVPDGMCLDGATVRPIVAPEPNDLVIDEVMPDPKAVGDTDGEWFEVAVKRDVDLNGLEIGTTPGTPLVTITDPICHRRAAGSYVLFARDADPTTNGGLPAVEATFPFSLPNASGSLFVGIGGNVLDKITWSDSSSGASRSLSFPVTDTTSNDFDQNWCDGSIRYGAGDLGTPGRQNSFCPIVLPPGMCLDGNHRRAIVAPGAGDLVVSEIMQDPTAVGDTDGEWFEITVNKDVDLNEIELGAINGTSVTTIGGTDCRRRTAGTRLLFARNDDPTMNGGLTGIEATFGFSLSNGAGSLQITSGDTVVDQVTWASTTPGRSRSLDPDSLDAAANDLDASWCPSTHIYGAGDDGSPGQPNEQCPVVVPPGMCLEADGTTLRPLVTPVAGDLVLSEVMADPTKVADGAGEYFEVTVLHDVDVNGLQAGLDAGNPQMTVTGTACQRRTAGTQMVFTHSTNSDTNGGVTGAETTTFTFSLANDSGTLAIRMAGGDVLDEIEWSAAPTGASLQLDPDSLDPTANDDPTTWCPSTKTYGLGDLGSPGKPNEQCPIVLGPGMCFDGGTPRDLVPIQVGDIVISEVMPNPAGNEPTREWFEVTLLHDADLGGLDFGTVNGTVLESTADMDCHHHAMGDVVIFARPPAVGGDDGGLPPVEGLFHFTLANSSGVLFIAKGGTLLDQVTWTTSSDGQSRSLDPGSLDPTLNDTDGNWCLSTSTYGAGGAGTPGMPNEVCIPAGMCLDGGTLRSINAIQPGDVVVSEIMAGQTDPNRDWFELTLKTARDLNGLQLGNTVGTASVTLGGRACLSHAAGQLVFAASGDAAANGGLPAPDGLVGFTLDATGTVWLGVGGATLDATSWSAVTQGASRNLDPGKIDAAQNDADASWCPATVAFGDGGLGSPGAPNETCPAVVPMCLDGDGVTMRPIVAPAVGDLLVTEVMANPNETNETGFEWFEVAVLNEAVDLAGLSVSSNGHTTAFSTTDCQRVTAGTFLVFANGSTDLPSVDYLFNFTLNNSNSSVAVSVGGVQLDSAAWTSTTNGVSRTLKKTKFDTVSNDTAANFCNSTGSYGVDGNKGSPGMDDANCQ